MNAYQRMSSELWCRVVPEMRKHVVKWDSQKGVASGVMRPPHLCRSLFLCPRESSWPSLQHLSTTRFSFPRSFRESHSHGEKRKNLISAKRESEKQNNGIEAYFA